MTVLSHEAIVNLCSGVAGTRLVEPYDARHVRTAGYDMRFGTEFFLSSAPTGGALIPIETVPNHASKVVEVPPNQIIVVQMLEAVNMPHNLVGHLSLKMELLLKGIIMASQSQIDAGYQGPIFALLYNLAAEPVWLSPGDPVLRLEFAQLDRTTAHAYGGKFQADYGVGDVVKQRLGSSLSSMQQSIREFRAIGIVAIAIFLAGLIGIVVTLLGPILMQSASADASARYSADQVTQLQSQVNSLSVEVERLKAAQSKASPTT
jgi:deoxycytidine triphosphate deaminase